MPEDRTELLIEGLHVFSERHAAAESLKWQVPALSLTAQAFLLTIALTATSAPFARYLAASLSFSIAVMSAQLMAHLQYFRLLWQALIERVAGELPGGAGLMSMKEELEKKLRRPLFTRGSHEVWMVAIALFGIADLLVIAFSIWRPSVFVR
jgi:hypothetical protein